MKVKQMINELKKMQENINSYYAYKLTFSFIKLTKDDKIKMENYQKQRFKLWSDSWVKPKIEYLLKELGEK